MSTWLAEPIARLREIIEGTYPTSPVTGRSTTAGRFVRATYRDDPSSPLWPGLGFHRAYLITVQSTRDLPGAAANWRTGRVLKGVTFDVRVGYIVQPDSREVADGSCPDEESATQLGHEDAHEIEEALRWPDFWAGTTPSISQIRPAGDVSTTLVLPRRRVFVTSRWDMTADFAPGQSWT